MANLKRMMKRFGEEVGKLTFAPPVTYVYNPLDYAFAGHEAFINKFFRRAPSSGAGEEADAEPRPTMLVSMNPGPYGMTQSGVPFGAPKIVQSWMGINLPADAIRPPEAACPYRPIFGFSPVPITPTEVDDGEQKKKNKSRKKRVPARQPSLREEVSGKRIYVNWAMNTYPSAEAFFEQFYIHPYCPIQFLEASGTNITPDKLHKDDRTRLYEVCDRYLREAILMMRPQRIVTIGNFADERVRYTLRQWQEGEATSEEEDLLQRLVVGKIPHPSPRSPVARLVWAHGAHKVNELLRSYGVDVPIAAAEDDASPKTKETTGSAKRGRASAASKSPSCQRSESSSTGLPLSKRRRTQQVQQEG